MDLERDLCGSRGRRKHEVWVCMDKHQPVKLRGCIEGVHMVGLQGCELNELVGIVRSLSLLKDQLCCLKPTGYGLNMSAFDRKT